MEALIIVDVQNDFCFGGSLEVPKAKEIIKPINSLTNFFTTNLKPILLTRDWHTKDHCSFIEQGGSWPPHCIAGSVGACFSEELIVPSNAIIVSKAKHKDKDAYSGFEDTTLNSELKKRKVDTIIICGLATDYCVKNTVLDSLSNGYKTIVAKDGIRAVNIKNDDEIKAISEMTQAGASFLNSEEILSVLM